MTIADSIVVLPAVSQGTLGHCSEPMGQCKIFQVLCGERCDTLVCR